MPKKPDSKRLFGAFPKGTTPSITSSTLSTFSRHMGVSEEEGLRMIEEVAGGKVEITNPTEPFMVIVTDYCAVPGSRLVKCALCDKECWAAEQYGPLATYLCMTCAENGGLDDGTK